MITTLATFPVDRPRLLRRLGVAVVLVVSLVAPQASANTDSGNGPEADQTDGDQSRAATDGEAPETGASPNAAFPWPHEQFFYSLRVNGAEAMRATLKAGTMRKNGDKNYVPLGLSVQSLGFFDNVYPVDDRADTYLDPMTMRPYRSEKHFRESGKIRTYEVDYAHRVFAANVEKRKPDRKQQFKRAIPATTHDMMTWLYDLRGRELSTGDHFRFYVYDGWKLSHVYMTIVGKEDLYTPAGWFKAWKFDFVRKVVHSKHNRRAGRPMAPIMKVASPKEHHGSFWLSRDENHLPLKVTIPTSFGFGEAVLIKYNRHTD